MRDRLIAFTLRFGDEFIPGKGTDIFSRLSCFIPVLPFLMVVHLPILGCIIRETCVYTACGKGVERKGPRGFFPAFRTSRKFCLITCRAGMILFKDVSTAFTAIIIYRHNTPSFIYYDLGDDRKSIPYILNYTTPPGTVQTGCTATGANDVPAYIRAKGFLWVELKISRQKPPQSLNSLF